MKKTNRKEKGKKNESIITESQDLFNRSFKEESLEAEREREGESYLLC